MPKTIRVSSSINDQLLAKSPIDVEQLHSVIRYDLIQQLAHALYDTEVKTKLGISGTVYYIELNIVSDEELKILEGVIK